MPKSYDAGRAKIMFILFALILLEVVHDLQGLLNLNAAAAATLLLAILLAFGHIIFSLFDWSKWYIDRLAYLVSIGAYLSHLNRHDAEYGMYAQPDALGFGIVAVAYLGLPVVIAATPALTYGIGVRRQSGMEWRRARSLPIKSALKLMGMLALLVIMIVYVFQQVDEMIAGMDDGCTIAVSGDARLITTPIEGANGDLIFGEFKETTTPENGCAFAPDPLQPAGGSPLQLAQDSIAIYESANGLDVTIHGASRSPYLVDAATWRPSPFNDLPLFQLGIERMGRLYVVILLLGALALGAQMIREEV